MSVTLISVSHDTVVSNKHEEQTRHYYVNFQHVLCEYLTGSHATWSEAMGRLCHPGFWTLGVMCDLLATISLFFTLTQN